MRGFGLVGIHHRYEKKSPQIGTRVQGKKLEEKKKVSSSIPKYIFTVAVVLLLVLRFSGIVRHDDLTWSETGSNEDTLDDRNTTMLDDNIHVADANTHVKDDGFPMIDNGAIVPDDDSPVIDNEAIVPDDDSPVIHNGAIVPDDDSPVIDNEAIVPDDDSPVIHNGAIVPDNDSPVIHNEAIVPDGNVVVEAESDGNIIPDYDNNIIVEVESNGHMITYQHDPSIDNDVNMTEKIFGSAPLRENVDLEQCQKSPMDPSVNDTITARWGCDVFEDSFYNSEINKTKVRALFYTTHNNSYITLVHAI